MLIEPPMNAWRRRAAKAVLLGQLRAQNRVDRRSILGDAPVAVSLTSYAHRLETVDLAIETSAAAGPSPRDGYLDLLRVLGVAGPRPSPRSGS